MELGGKTRRPEANKSICASTLFRTYLVSRGNWANWETKSILLGVGVRSSKGEADNRRKRNTIQLAGR